MSQYARTENVQIVCVKSKELLSLLAGQVFICETSVQNHKIKIIVKYQRNRSFSFSVLDGGEIIR